MSQLVTDSKARQQSSQHNEAHYGSNILITLKNLKNERAKHHQENAVARNAQQSPSEGNISSFLMKRRHSRGDVQDESSAKKLQEIENQLRSCKNQRKEVLIVSKDICNSILKSAANNEKNHNSQLRNGSKQRGQHKQQIQTQGGLENKENASQIGRNDKNQIALKQSILVDKHSGLDKPSRSPIITKEYEAEGQQQNLIKQQHQRIPPKQQTKQSGDVFHNLLMHQKNNNNSKSQMNEQNNDSKPFYLGQQQKELIQKSRSKSYSLFFHSQKQLEEQQPTQLQDLVTQPNKQESFQLNNHNSKDKSKQKQFQQIYHSLQQQEPTPPKVAIPLRKQSQKITTISQQIIPKYFSEVQSKHHNNHNSIETPDKYSSKQKATGSCCIPILDQRRLSQNSLHNQSNVNSSQFSSEKQKRVYSAQGITRGSQQLQQQQHLSSVFLNKGYNNKRDSLSAKKKNERNYQSIGAVVESLKSSIQQKSTIEMKRQDDGTESTSRHRIPATSVSELRLKRIKDQNASKSRILSGLSSGIENAQNKLELVESLGKESKQQNSYLGSLIEDKSGALKEGAKKRIKDLIELQNRKKSNKDGNIQEESETKQQLNVEPDEIKGYIKGLMQVLNTINGSSKQISKREETQSQLRNSFAISKSERSSSNLTNASAGKKQYNAMDYGYSQGMSSEILHSVIIKKKELSADPKDNRSHRSLSPNNGDVSLNRQSSIQFKDKQSVLEGSKSIRDQKSENGVTSQNFLVQSASGNEPAGRRLSITDLKTEKINSGNDKMKQQKLQQGITNNQCSWFRSSEPIACKNSQDLEDITNSKNSRREGLIKVHRGRNIIKAINPYRSAVSLEQLKKQSIQYRSIDSNGASLLSHQEKHNELMDGQKQDQRKKQRSFTQQSASNLSKETDLKVDQATRKKLSLVIEDGCSMLQKCSFIDDAETVKTEQDCPANGAQNEKQTVYDGNYKSIHETEKNLVPFEDENHNEVSAISLFAHQLASSKIRNSFINSDLMSDLNLKRDNIPISLQQQQKQIAKSSETQYYIKNSSQMRNHQPVKEDYNSKMLNLDSEKKISKKPPTHKQIPKKHTENSQNDRSIAQQQPKTTSKVAQIPLNRQSSRPRLMSAQRVPTKYEILSSYQQQHANNQEDLGNPKNNSCNNGERILDLLLLNTNELKNQFQEQKQQQPQQQQFSIKKARSYSSVISSLPVPPQIPHNMNIFSEFAQQFFPPDSQLI